MIINDGKILLVKHKKLGAWLQPGGHVEPNETPYEAAIRESLEETGIRVTIIDASTAKDRINDDVATEMPQPIATLYERVPLKDGLHMHFDLVYLAAPEEGGNAVKSDESDDIRWFSKEEALKVETFSNVKSVIRRAFKIHESM